MIDMFMGINFGPLLGGGGGVVKISYILQSFLVVTVYILKYFAATQHFLCSGTCNFVSVLAHL